MAVKGQIGHLWGCKMGQKVVGSLGKSPTTAPKVMHSLISPLHPWISPPRRDTRTPATHPGLFHAPCPTPCRIEISVEEMQTSGGAHLLALLTKQHRMCDLYQRWGVNGHGPQPAYGECWAAGEAKESKCDFLKAFTPSCCREFC